MSESEPKIIFKNLKGFPEAEICECSEKIRTDLFLEASSEVVSVIEKFGTMFAPVVSDMRGNIEKLHNLYQLDPNTYYYIENLLIKTSCMENECTRSSLLWLKRALELILEFFQNILNDETTADNLKKPFKNAYEKTLKPYHGWLIQSAFSLIFGWLPTRSQLLGKGNLHNENIEMMSKFVLPMQNNLRKINELLKTLDIDK